MRPFFNGTLLGNRGGGGLGTVSISNVAGSSEADYPSSASCSYSLLNDGSSDEGGTSNRWLVGSTNGAAYDARVTVTSGSLSSGTTGGWVNLGTTRNWNVSRSSLGEKSCTFTVEIALAGTTTPIDTATVSITATVNSNPEGGG